MVSVHLRGDRSSCYPFMLEPFVDGLIAVFLHVRSVSVFCEELPQEIQVGVA